MYDRADKGKQPMHPNQSLWMSHWSAVQEQNQISTLVHDNGMNQLHVQKGKEVTSYMSRSSEKRTEVQAIDFGILHGNQAMSSRKERDYRLDSLDSSTVNLSQNRHHTLNTEQVPPLLSLAPPGTETSYMESHIQQKTILQCPSDLVKSQMVLSSSLAFPESLAENLSGTASHVSSRLYDLGEGRLENRSNSKTPSFVCSVEENGNHVRSILPSKRKLSDTNIRTVAKHEKCSNHCAAGFVSDDLCMKNNHPPSFCEERYKRMHNCSDFRKFVHFLSRKILIHICGRKIKDLGIQDFLLCRKMCPSNVTAFPSFLVLVSREYSSSSCPHQIVKGNIIFMMSMLLKFFQRINHQLKLTQYLGKRLTRDIFQDGKANTDRQCHDHATSTTGEEVQPRKRPIPEIPDMNLELPAEPDEASVVDNAEASTSRTRSLDIDYEPDTSSRWIKRLKISDSSSHSIGTKSLSLDEATSDKNQNQFVSNGLRGEKANSNPVPLSAGKELMVLTQKTNPPRTGSSCLNDNFDGTDGTKQLHSWIQRWQKNPATAHEKQPEPVVVCDPQSSKVSLEELQRKPFASIAAMALLGKGWSGLKCQYRNVGPLTLWDSKDM
ncbi:uncharacterized protein LOC108204976 isoform X2 [Daucus carota subsp. sativus]|uniref:uncharacterized protein LOC108204976 isoform X2 n=1 Tax=Daucus carota subsp. sativus TaxID=79200 RepID=UPI0007F002DE|nr:PREDICTED: uncharacterized protein LOC108204976 isoform X2 [Daucus carota subsp. sativus]